MITDCHCHLSLMDRAETWRTALDKLLLDMKNNGIKTRIIIADNVSDSDCADTKRLLELTSGMPTIKIIGSINPFTYQEDDLEYFDALLSEKRIVGLKIFPGHDKVYADNPILKPSVDLCLKHGVPLTIHTGVNSDDKECSKYNDPKLIANIAKKYPKLKIIIAHYFWPKLERCFSETEGYENIYFDISALADDEVVLESGGLGAMRSILEKTISRNPHSVIFGTDYPMCSTNLHVALVNSLNISSHEKENILHKNAANIFTL